MIRIGLVSAPCGAGKTFVATNHAISIAQAGEKVIICQPSLQLIDQTIHDVRTKNPHVKVTAYHTGTHEGFVIPQLAAHFKEAGDDGEILLMTHAALERIGYIENKIDWNLLYDEVPQVEWSLTFTLAENREMLLELISTLPAEENPDYLVVEARDNSIMREFSRNINDDQVRAIFRDMATKIESAHSTVYVLKEQFENFSAGNINQLTVFALVSPSLFAGFRSAVVLAADVEDSNMLRYWKKQPMHQVDFYRGNKLLKKLQYDFHPNGDTLDIFYALDKPWSKTVRDKVITPDQPIRTVQEWIEFMTAETLTGDPFVYMVNKDMEAKLFSHEQVQEKLGRREQLPNTTHGLNQFKTYNNVVCFSALNPPPSHYKFLQEVAGIDPDEVKAAGYRQSVYQAAMRISLRDPTNRENKRVVVMDKATAEDLPRKIPNSRIHKMNTVDLDAAIDATTRKRGQPKKWANDAERKRAERAAKKRRDTTSSGSQWHQKASG